MCQDTYRLSRSLKIRTGTSQDFHKRRALRIGFESFVLDGDTRQLTRGGEGVHLTPKAFDLLSALIDARPRLLSKTTLFDLLWPETFVADANLSNLVAEVRRALHDDAGQPRWIRTAHGAGYAFAGEAVPLERGHPPFDAPVCWLEWGSRRFPLASGAHIVGRDPDVEVRLDASTVSRRHARLVVAADGVVLEDLGSKNGTRRGEDAVASAVPLSDGDAIHFGSLRLTFRERGRATSTATQPTAR